MLILLGKLNDGFVERDEDRQLDYSCGEALQRINLLFHVHACHFSIHFLRVVCVSRLDVPHKWLDLSHPCRGPQLPFIQRVDQALDKARIKNQRQSKCIRLKVKVLFKGCIKQLNQQLIHINQLLEHVEAGVGEALELEAAARAPGHPARVPAVHRRARPPGTAVAN